MNQIVNIFLKKVNKFLNILPNSNLLIAFSGGQDSGSLLFFLEILKVQLQVHFYLIYCNHLWTTEALPIQYSLLQLTYIFPKKFYIAIPFNFIRTELSARKWRYCTFQRVSYLTQTQHLLTGHTKSDQIETFFINLIKGSGVQKSLVWKRDNYWPKSACFSEKKKNIRFINCKIFVSSQLNLHKYSILLIRPLLFLNRYEIHVIINILLFPVWPDKTNINLNYFRNRIRHLLLPILRFYFIASFDYSISRYLDIVYSEFQFFDLTTKQLLLSHNQNNFSTNNRVSYSLGFFLSIPYIYQKRIIIKSFSLITNQRLSNCFIVQLIQLIQIFSKKTTNTKPKTFFISKNLLLIFFKNKFYLQKVNN